MYLVPVLLGVDAADPARAEALVAGTLRQHALHVDCARRLSADSAAIATFHLLVYANGIELTPAERPRR
jgi:hypothetical protein